MNYFLSGQRNAGNVKLKNCLLSTVLADIQSFSFHTRKYIEKKLSCSLFDEALGLSNFNCQNCFRAEEKLTFSRSICSLVMFLPFTKTNILSSLSELYNY